MTKSPTMLAFHINKSESADSNEIKCIQFIIFLMNEWLLTVLSEIEMLKGVRTINAAINTYRERGYTLISLKY